MSILAFRNVSYYERWIFKPYDVYRGIKVGRIITSGFIHADWMHLFVNMLVFYNFSFSLERIVGSVNFTIIYFGTLVLSSLSTLYKQRNNIYYRSLGASGAVCGVLFSYIIFNPLTPLIVIPIPIPIPAFIWAFGYLGYSVYASKRNHDYINHEAHYWGAISGVVLTLLLEPNAFLSLFNGLG